MILRITIRNLKIKKFNLGTDFGYKIFLSAQQEVFCQKTPEK